AYSVLVVTDSSRMSVPALTKVRDLIDSGATIVVGERPGAAPGLSGYPDCDDEIRRLAGELWGPAAPSQPQSRSVGGGRLVQTNDLGALLASEAGGPDVDILDPHAAPEFAYIHRTDTQAEIYFLSNQSHAEYSVGVAFRQRGEHCEIWDAVTGQRWRAACTAHGPKHVSVTLRFAPAQSFFVLFSKQAPAAGPRLPEYIEQEPTAVATLEGGWDVHFDPAWGGPGDLHLSQLIDWSAHSDDRVRYYSGTAIYRKVFDLPEQRARRGQRVYLDLGGVDVIASVRINGRDSGTVWTAPWRLEVTDHLVPGKNTLEISVANLWINRLIRDAELPEGERLTWTTWNPYTRDTPLERSGLIGPVRLLHG
ncbi:MAG: glycosylhydrolase-like jelly roll fold domain-containing protein, partial [bacterium]